jgi:MFS transporter, SP family, general alpha glucoside:H+ symporter
MWGFLLPYLFNPDKANLGAKVTFIFGALSVLSIVYLFIYQPESAGLSYERLDELFISRAKARMFREQHSRSSRVQSDSESGIGSGSEETREDEKAKEAL